MKDFFIILIQYLPDKLSLMVKNYFLKLFSLFSLLFMISYQAQMYSIDELDSITNVYKTSGDIEQAVDFNQKALKQYKKNDNREGIVAVNINLGNLLCTLNQYKESISYLDEAKSEISTVKNPYLYSRLYNEYGRNYSLLGLFAQGNENLNKAIRYTRKISNQDQRKKQLYYSYTWKWYNFESLKKMDSVYSMQKKCLAILQEPLTYVKAAGRFTNEKKHLDSAEYYLKKAVPLFEKSPADQKALTLLLFGELYAEKKEYQKALDFYFQSLVIFKKIKRKEHVRNVYEGIFKTYKALNNQGKAEEYYKNYSFLNDSISAREKKVLQVIVEKLDEEKKQEERDKTRLYVLISVISIIFLGLLYFLRKAYLEKQRKKDRLIEQKDELIEIQAQETDQLKKKVNDAFPQLIKLAKTNDPFFMTRFREVYPEFYDKLMSQYPDLKESDLKICAFIRLNLNNKEIGQYENITLRAIETRKYRLKKKLGLAPDDDLNSWIQNL